MYRIVLCAGIFLNSVVQAETVLVFGGATGWIGKKIVALLARDGHQVVCAQSRLENRESIIQEIARVNPDSIINAAGLTGKPNVDWCETNRQETIRVNVVGTLTLADVAYQHKLHLTNISTGCIYEYDEQHPVGSGKGFTEEDAPNFDGSFYSRTKIMLEKLLMEYPNVLNFRVKMPVSLDFEQGFIAKIIRYKKINSIPNSLCVLDELLPIAVDMTMKRVKGNFNFVNPGAISHNEVLELYKKYINPSHTYENFSTAELNAQLKARRANAELSTDKLRRLYPNILPIRDAIENLFKAIAAGQQ